MQINIKEELEKMLFTYMVQPNSNIASVSLNDVIERYLTELTTRVKQKHYFTDGEYSRMVNLAIKLKNGDYNLNTDEKFFLLKNNSSKNNMAAFNVEDLDDDTLRSISSDSNSIIIPSIITLVNNNPVSVKIEGFETIEDLLKKLKSCGKYYIYNVFKSSGQYHGEYMEMYHANYIPFSNLGMQAPTSLPKMSQRELEELKKLGFETNNLIDNVDLTGEDDE